MKIFVVLFVFGAFYQASAMRLWGWFSDEDNTDEVIDSVAEKTQECRQLAHWGQCAFYDCIEDRFPCGAEGYTQKISKHFCSKIDTHYNTFDDFGRRWLNQTSICLQGYMLPIYEQESSSCAEIKNAGINAILGCNAGEVDGHDFCDFVDSNGDAYNALMGREEIMLMAALRDHRVFSSMVTQAVQCGVRGMAETLSSVGASISGLAGSVYTSFRGWFSSS